jgi:PilZ domain
MFRIASTLSPELAQLLERDLLRRADVHLLAVRSIDELVSATRDGAELCLVEPLLPDGDALDALHAIRATTYGARVPVVLVTPGDTPAGDTPGFSAQIGLPAPAGAIEELLGKLLSAPRRRDLRRAASARVFDESGAPIGRLVDVAAGGVALRTRRTFEVGARAAIALELPTLRTPVPVQARVLRAAGEHVALALESPSEAARDALALLITPPSGEAGLSFRPLPTLGPRGAAVGGNFDGEGPAHAALLAFLGETSADPARLYVGDLVPFNERALDRWIELLEAVGPVELLCAPAWLRALADRMPAALRTGARIASTALLVRCLACGDESDREARIEGKRADARAVAAEVIAAPCALCAGQVTLDDPMESSFLFLAA